MELVSHNPYILEGQIPTDCNFKLPRDLIYLGTVFL